MSVASVSHAIQSLELFTAVRQSAIFYPAVLATHLTCIAIFGGMILMTDLRLMGLALTNTPVASVIESTRWWKRGGFVIMICCGILLAGSKLDQYYANPFLLMKLSLLALIGVHGLVFRHLVYADPAALDRPSALPLRARLAGGLSLILWLCVLTCGRWIAYYDAPEPKSMVGPAQGWAITRLDSEGSSGLPM